jgi:hypothetical protein
MMVRVYWSLNIRYDLHRVKDCSFLLFDKDFNKISKFI